MLSKYEEKASDDVLLPRSGSPLSLLCDLPTCGCRLHCCVTSWLSIIGPGTKPRTSNRFLEGDTAIRCATEVSFFHAALCARAGDLGGCRMGGSEGTRSNCCSEGMWSSSSSGSESAPTAFTGILRGVVGPWMCGAVGGDVPASSNGISKAPGLKLVSMIGSVGDTDGDVPS